MDDQLYLSLSKIFWKLLLLKNHRFYVGINHFSYQGFRPGKNTGGFPKLLRVVENNSVIYRNAYLDQHISKIFYLPPKLILLYIQSVFS